MDNSKLAYLLQIGNGAVTCRGLFLAISLETIVSMVVFFRLIPLMEDHQTEISQTDDELF